MLREKAFIGGKMFCTECGADIAREQRFCGNCGAPVGTMGKSVPGDSPTTLQPHEWAESVDFRTVVNNPSVHQQINRAAGMYEKGMSASEFLKATEPLLNAIGAGVPLRIMGELLPGWYGRMGIRTGKSDARDLALPPGRIIAAVLCSFAARSQALVEGLQATDGCAFKARMPSSMWHFGGELSVVVTARTDAVRVEAATHIPGQLYDWGASQQAIAALFEDIPRFASLQS
jgi:hypothetical protein